jgi:hypothetical protein
MQGVSGDYPVMPFLTPLRTGIVTATYVRTDNTSIPDGSSGRIRHEWFSLALFSGEQTPLWASDDPCSATAKDWLSANAAEAVGETVLIMEPSFTHIEVRDPDPFYVYFMGALGGAMSILDLLFLYLLVMFYKARNLMCRSTDNTKGEMSFAQGICDLA